jgi:ankyrin repeat protein
MKNNTQFWEAIEKNKLDDLKKLINEVGVDARDETGNTALMHASWSGHIETTKFLIEKGANVNAANQDRKTALMHASGNGHIETTKFLIEKGANVDASDVNGKTALIEVCMNGNRKMIETLIDNGADVNKFAPSSFTPLMYAIRGGHDEIAQFLIDKGANVDVTLMHSIRAVAADAKITQALIEKGANVDVTDENGNTALMLAIMGGRDEITQVLIKKGANINATNENSNTALMLAIMHGRDEITQVLIEKGAGESASVDAVNKYGDDALTLANRYNKVQVFNELLNLGANSKNFKLNEAEKVNRDFNLLKEYKKSILNGKTLAPSNNCINRIKLKALNFIQDHEMEEIKKNPKQLEKIKNSGYYTLLQLQENEAPENSNGWLKAIFKNTQEFKDFYEKVKLFSVSSKNEQQDRVFSTPELKNKILESLLGENLKRDLQNLGKDSTSKFIEKIVDIVSKTIKPSASPSTPSIQNSPERGGEGSR